MFKLIHDLVISDSVALQKWSIIVDHIVHSEPDKLRIQRLLMKDRPDYEHAIRETLNLLEAHGDSPGDLVRLFRDHKLNSLADKIVEHGVTGTKILPPGPGGCGFTTTTITPRLGVCVWFEVGEIVYNFTGREPELQRLHERLRNSHSTESSTANIVSVCGLGGVGKSTLAKKYAFKYRDDYNGNMVWVNAETVDSMRASFVRLANRLGLPTSEQDSNQVVSGKIYEKFQDCKSLLIFDNVEESSHLKQFLPRIDDPNKQTPYLLVTTRRNDVALLPENQLNLNVLEMDEAIALIRKQLPYASDIGAEKLADTLQRHPLGLQQALAYIRDAYTSNGDCISKYLAEFQASEKILLEDERFRVNNDYSKTTYATWSITLARIRTMNGGQVAIRAIHALAYLNPDWISEQLVRNILEDECQTERGLKLLELFSMISVMEEKVVIHRLVQKVVRLQLTSEQEIRVLESVIRVIQLQFHKDKLTNYARECMSHGLHLFPFQVDRCELMKDRSQYLSDLCYFLIGYGNYSDSLTVAERSSAMYESMVGKEHEDTIKMKWRTADAYHHLCKYSAAMKLLESILPIAKSKLGPEHELAMGILLSIAQTHTEMGQHQKGFQIYAEIIPVRVRLFGENDNYVLVAKAEQAMALRKLGRLDQALELFQYVYEKRVGLHGEKDLRTLDTRESIGFVFYDKGHFGKAIAMWSVVYKGYKQVVGESHPYTITIKKNVKTATAKAELKRIK